MNDPNLKNKKFASFNKVDTKEFELPDTVFISDIETKVFQGIILQCLSEIEGIALVEGNFIDSMLGRSSMEVTGIHSQKDQASHSVSLRIEVNIEYGVPIPAKADEIQTKVIEAITRLTGLHVSTIHIVFKNVIPSDQTRQILSRLEKLVKQPEKQEGEHEYSDEF